MPPKLLVTGASGLLGTRLCELALEKEYQVYSIFSQHISRYGTPIRLDITDSAAIQRTFQMLKPEAVVHAAALSDVDRCEKEKELAWKTNVKATTTVADLCRRHRAFLVYLSTDYVFDGKKGMYKEDDKPAPINYYGLTKLKGEQVVKESCTKCCIARTSVIYGAIPAAGKTNFALWLLDKLERREKATIATDQWNSPTLNTSLAEMVLEIVERRLTGTFHLAGATRVSRYEFATLLAKTFQLDLRPLTPTSSKDIPWVARRPRDSSLDTEKATLTLTRKPMQILDALELMKKDLE
jgi:dTDP-4-dehydrorhamnose reductase